jgi:hypothetical protein
MAVIIDRGDTRAGFRGPGRRRHGGPVVLATFARTPFGARTARLAVEAAAEMGSTVVVVQMVDARSKRRRDRAAAEAVGPALAAAVDAVRALAAEFAVPVEALRVSSPRPVVALLGFVADRRPALVVFATDPAALHRFRRPTRRQYRRFVAALAAHADGVLLWTAQEPRAAAAAAASAASRRAARAGAASVRGRGVQPGHALKMSNPGRKRRRRRWLTPAPRPI